MTDKHQTRKRKPAERTVAQESAPAPVEPGAEADVDKAVHESAGVDETAAQTAAAEAAGEPGARQAADEDAEGSGEEGRRRPLTDEERADLYKQQLKELRLLDVARDMMLTLVTVGYQKLGLTDETRELRDLDEAHLAIELLRGIVGAVEGVADAGEIETYRSTLAQMQLNYARVAAQS